MSLLSLVSEVFLEALDPNSSNLQEAGKSFQGVVGDSGKLVDGSHTGQACRAKVGVLSRAIIRQTYASTAASVLYL